MIMSLVINLTMIITTLAVMIAGGIGAVCRFVLDSVIQQHNRSSLPVGTILINVSGSLLLGLLAGLAGHGLSSFDVLAEQAYAILGTGFLGGYTTFSTACVETVRLLQRKRYRAALRAGFVTLIIATLAATLGYLIGGGRI